MLRGKVAKHGERQISLSEALTPSLVETKNKLLAWLREMIDQPLPILKPEEEPRFDDLRVRTAGDPDSDIGPWLKKSIEIDDIKGFEEKLAQVGTVHLG